MNLLQTFLADARAQVRTVVDEEFTIDGLSPVVVFFGAFGAPQLIPIMTDVGYQDHLVIPLTAPVTQVNGAFPAFDTLARRKITRTATGRSLFVRAVDYTDPVKLTFLLTDRSI